MQVLLSKMNMFFCSILSLLLDNGKGRAVVETVKSESDPSGFSMFIRTILDAIVNFLMNLAEALLRILAQIAYFIAKIVLNIMDFMNIVIKELSGQATSYSVAGNSSLKESDILFQFMFNELTVKILKNVFYFSLLLLIIFTIIAIVKQEWDNRVNGKLSSIKKVFRKMILSIFTMIITPFILIVSIIFSNVVLASVMSALSGQGGSFSIGAQIFAASTYDANAYREYAVNGKKIPIVFDYEGGFENVITTPLPEYSTSSTTAQEQDIKAAINNGSFTTGQTTYKMFTWENFYEFSSVQESSAYYDIYDGPYLKTKQIEYYAMADFIDYAMQSGATFYIVNVEDVYESAFRYIYYNDVPDPEENKFGYEAINKVVSSIDAVTMDNDKMSEEYVNLKVRANAFVNGDVVIDYYTFNVYYNEARASVLNSEGVNASGVAEYISVDGATDEVTGAKYLFCTRFEVEEGEYIYLPVTLNDSANNIMFTSNFLADAPLLEGGTPERPETMFVARGLFTSEGYPTAIKNEGLDITFYRHNAKAPSVMDFSQIFNYQSENDSDSGFSAADTIEFLSGVDVSSMVPDIQVNLNFLQVFSKDRVGLASLDNGKFTLNYSFAGTGFGINNVYNVLGINYVVLLFACTSLFMGLFYMIWGLIVRIYEITLLWITMPGWIAKFPLDKDDNIGSHGTGFGKWKDKMIERVLALFAIYASLALLFLLIPIVFKIVYISSFNIPETNIFGIFNADVANLVIKTAFILVLFTFLRLDNGKDGKKAAMGSAPKYIEDIILLSGRDPAGGYLTQIGRETFGDVKAQINKAKGYFTPIGIYKNIKGTALNVARGAVNAIPGKAVADHIMDMGSNIYQGAKDKIKGSNIGNAQQNLLSKTTEDDIKQAAKDLQATTKDDAYMKGFKQARKDYWRNTGEGLEDDFRKRNAEFKSVLTEVAKKGGGYKFKVGNKKVKARKRYRQIKKQYK